MRRDVPVARVRPPVEVARADGGSTASDAAARTRGLRHAPTPRAAAAVRRRLPRRDARRRQRLWAEGARGDVYVAPPVAWGRTRQQLRLPSGRVSGVGAAVRQLAQLRSAAPRRTHRLCVPEIMVQRPRPAAFRRPCQAVERRGDAQQRRRCARVRRFRLRGRSSGCATGRRRA